MTTQIGATRRIIVTRSKEGNRELGESLREAGFEAISVDTLSFFPPSNWSEVDGRLRSLHQFDWLIFTSGVGATFFIRRMNKLLLETRWRGKPSVAAVGPGTREILERAGIKVQFIPSEYLTMKLAFELPLDRGKKVLLFRADIAEGDLLRTLQRRGFLVEERAIYRTRFILGEYEADLGSADAIIFASPSAIEGFCNRITPQTVGSLIAKPVLCIGPITARAAKARGFKRIITPNVHTFDSLVRELRRL